MMRRVLEWGIGLAVLCGLTAMYRLHGGEALWFMMFLTCLVLAGGMLVQLLGPRQIRVERSLPKSLIPSGEAVPVTMRIYFHSPLPLPWLAVEDHYTGGSFRRVLFPGFRRSLTYRYELPALPRGHYGFEACALEWGGLFGWFQGRKVVKGEGRFIVLPEPLPVGQECRPAASLSYSEEASPRYPRFADGMKGMEVREYVPGDPPNRIHWKHLARWGSLHTSLPEEAQASSYAVMIDRSFSGYMPDGARAGEVSGEAAQQGFETAISTAAGLLVAAGRAGEKAVLLGSGFRTGVPGEAGGLGLASPQETEPEVTGMLAALSGLTLSGGIPLPAQLQEAAGNLTGKRTAVVTGYLTDELLRTVSGIISSGGYVDIYCAGAAEGNDSIDSASYAAAVHDPGLFRRAALLSRLGAGVFIVHDGRVSRIGHVETTFPGEGAV
ncbi:DUF58 domain-containing protein [Paenibacillus sp. XY044]|uniref:DUF58 domain-containing protein n=1 Tax=Paenibacillus sp. XY044 TaxID=2026089 RepID=UPI000B98EF2B|nr:DUF58 domain-containing protein [Paenibacillus sp. XY044]OZB90384.1 hypothetical protein CJP46_34200 [Paenibacillus sp. XY044]